MTMTPPQTAAWRAQRRLSSAPRAVTIGDNIGPSGDNPRQSARLSRATFAPLLNTIGSVLTKTATDS